MAPTKKIIRASSVIITGVLALVITTSLIWFSSQSTYIIQVSIEPDYENGVNLKRDQKIISYKSGDAIIYDISGSVANPTTSAILVYLKGPADKKFSLPDSIEVSISKFFETIMLVPGGISIQGDEKHAYRINSAAGDSLLSYGYIHLQIIEIIPGTNPWGVIILSAIGLLASVIQIIQLFTVRQTEKNA